ncbi:hypothetical protein BGE01nite_21660 [Brevifollis gellanilyticus]|uniref:Uncharacterized protein n=1 Tax=Brevifollis gellanilyticus TaxID=748831 RepID=A0A512M829_9BACT|nr:hypothetical protein BGE01nite_21660 [Brevifollis gellanilyticus]
MRAPDDQQAVFSIQQERAGCGDRRDEVPVAAGRAHKLAFTARGETCGAAVRAVSKRVIHRRILACL